MMSMTFYGMFLFDAFIVDEGSSSVCAGYRSNGLDYKYRKHQVLLSSTTARSNSIDSDYRRVVNIVL